ncbi:MAG: PDZ domain-containing protein [Phycisphaerae bacterium]|nr:PDZ domain-containing protein [Phycisphaerae bacterium]
MTRLTFTIVSLAVLTAPSLALDFFVSPNGDDNNPGTKQKPFATPVRARDAARQAMKTPIEPITVHLRAGTYYLDEPLVLVAEDSGTRNTPLAFVAWQDEKPVLSGGVKLKLKWKPHRNRILQAKVPTNLTFTQLFVNGKRQHLARYPNFDPDVRIFNGYAKDAFGPERAARWDDPRGGFIHAMHRSMWGDFHYVITGKKPDGGVTYEGGWQNNRRMGMHRQYRFVENIFEELDAPGEWFLNTKTNTLYFYPPAGLDPGNAAIEAVRLRHLVEFRGTVERPVRFVTLRGLTFRHTARTFMDNREPLLRSDWTTYRGAAVFIAGAEDCSVVDCEFDQVGGNTIFVNKYNRCITVRGCHIHDSGANGIAFVGDPNAVHNPLFEYGQRQNYSDIDKTPGPKSPNYPADCLIEDCLIYRTGCVEKQTAPVQIAMARRITVRHCSIYDVPRAGINIGDGCWGGHVIEFCDVFDTVKETGDHGSFNSWGRDRFWGLRDIDLNTITLGEHRNLPLLDAVEPTILRNNRWRCDHGWDIDLDDGSSNYRIYNNLCLHGGIKNREGFYRVVENNIMVDNSFHPHVWYRNSRDIFRRNIVFTPYRPIRVNKPWPRQCDFNLLHKPQQSEAATATVLQNASGRDEHSLEVDALFVAPEQGDYRLGAGSPALELGFRNFPMDKFGVQKPSLKALARTAQLPSFKSPEPEPPQRRQSKDTAHYWQQVKVRNIEGLADRSAYGLPDATGVLVLNVPKGSVAAKSGLRKDDVIVECDGKEIKQIKNLPSLQNAAGKTISITVYRSQNRVTMKLSSAK